MVEFLIRKAAPLVAACILTCAAGYHAWPVVNPPAATLPMPEATPVKAAEAAPAVPGVLRVTRIELIDPATGKLVLILAGEGGEPIAIVSDNGRQRRANLAALIRRFG